MSRLPAEARAEKPQLRGLLAQRHDQRVQAPVRRGLQRTRHLFVGANTGTLYSQNFLSRESGGGCILTSG